MVPRVWAVVVAPCHELSRALRRHQGKWHSRHGRGLAESACDSIMVSSAADVIVSVVALVCAFCMGRWTTIGGGASGGLRSASSRMQVSLPPEDELRNPPPGHGAVAVPSVIRDVRGETNNLRIGGFRFNVLVSRAGSVRSGDVHQSDQYDMIFQGNVQLTTRERGKSVVREYGRGDLIVIPKHVPHLFRFPNHTVMAEWWDGPFEARYYVPYRTIVDRATQKLSAASRRSRADNSSRRSRAPSEAREARGSSHEPLPISAHRSSLPRNPGFMARHRQDAHGS